MMSFLGCVSGCSVGVVVVHAAGQDGEALWIAMELVEGRSLQARLSAEGPLPVREAAE